MLNILLICDNPDEFSDRYDLVSYWESFDEENGAYSIPRMVEKNSYLLYIAIIAATVNVILNLMFTENGVEYAARIYCITWIIQYLGTLIAIYYAKKNFTSI